MKHPSPLTTLILSAPAFLGSLPAPAKDPSPPTVATFSIVAIDPATGEIGVAVQSRIVAVGAVVPWAKAGVGAVATQSYANVTFGPAALEQIALGNSPVEALQTMLEGDSLKSQRQVGLINAAGETAQFTGTECLSWAGGRMGKGYAVQGNILAGPAVVEAMAEAFEKSADLLLAERLLAALDAGQAAGGDRRGQQSAALLIVREGWGYGGGNDRFRDLRVDEHVTPILELRRVYYQHCDLFPRPDGRVPRDLSSPKGAAEAKAK